MIINIPLGAFGGPLRNGDMIAVANVVQHLRIIENKEVKFHLFRDTIQDVDYCKKFYNFLLKNTDYFSETLGDTRIPWKNINLWDYRGMSGDLVQIKNTRNRERKIVICPLFNATYNTYRNWPRALFDRMIEGFKEKQYDNYVKIICTEEDIQIPGWITSKDFETNLEHIMSCEVFIGGDTGTSHFAGALFPGPPDLSYYYSGHGLLHTTPFYSTMGKGRLIQYWKDVEEASWEKTK
jgi:hypothetical protein